MSFMRSAAAEVRVRLSGVPAFVAGMAEADSSVGKFQKKLEVAGMTAEKATKRSWIMDQALFTLRRYAYAATLGITALGGAAVMMGLKFNASMEMNQVAFTQFLGSTSSARKELDILYNIAKKTPFEFSGVTDAARRFLAFGYTVRDTNKYLKTIGDTVAAFGGGNEQIERMVTVFGQIRASGRLLGQDMLQLEQQGIPVIDILYEQLKKMGYQIKRTQLSRIGELGMPASIGIPALMRGMQERFGGMSAKQLQTMQGQLSNLHDSIQQVMGAITFGSFKAGKSFVRNLNRSFDQMTALMKKQKGKISLDQALVILGKSSPAMRDLVAVVRLTIAVLKPLGIILMQIVVPALVMLLWVIRQLSKPLLPILHLMQKFPKLMYIVSAALAFVTAAWALETLIIIWNNTVVEQSNRWGKRLGATQAGLGRILNILRWRFAKTGTAAGLYNAWMRKTAQSSNGAFRSYTRLEKGVRLLRIGVDKLIIRLKALKVQMWETMVENPVGAIIVGIILLLTFLIILYFKWKWFHNLVNRVAHYLWHHWLLMLTIINLLIPGLGLIIALVVILTKHWGGLFKVLGDIWNLFKRLFFWLADQVKTMGGMLIEYFRPLYYPVLYLIVGGFKEMVSWLRTAVKWAKTLVGWIAKIKGPASWVWGKVKGAAGAVAGAYNWGNQVLSPYPQAAAATNSGVVGTGAPSDPISKSVDRGKNAKGGHIQVTTNIHVDGKKVAEATSRHRQDRSARR